MEDNFKEKDIRCRRTKDTVFVKRDSETGIVKMVDCPHYSNHGKLIACDKNLLRFLGVRIRCVQIDREYEKFP